MTEATKTTLTIDFDEDTAYAKVVSFNDHVDQGVLAESSDDTELALDHAKEAINTLASLMNDLLPDEVWERFGERYMTSVIDSMN